MKIEAIVLLFAIPVLAQTPKPADKTKPPVITDAQKKEFFKAQAGLLQAEEAENQARQIMQQRQSIYAGTVKTLQDACGKDFTLKSGPDGDPYCAVEPSKPEVKK